MSKRGANTRKKKKAMCAMVEEIHEDSTPFLGLISILSSLSLFQQLAAMHLLIPVFADF